MLGANHAAAPLQKEDIPPQVSLFPQPLPSSHFAKFALVKRDAGRVFRENARLQRPCSAAVRLFHQRKQKRLANTSVSRVGSYENGYFGDAE